MPQTALKQDLPDSPQQTTLDQLMSLYKEFGQLERTDLEGIYTEDILFKDPVHEINGLDNLLTYMNGLAQRLHYCEFEFSDSLIQGDRACLVWDMYFAHPAIRRGADLSLPGTTILTLDKGVSFQQDYYDLGAMLYEHLPLLGMGIQAVKKRLQS